MNFTFEQNLLECVVGGKSAIDLPRLEIQDLPGAEAFAATYGYDLKNPTHQERLWLIHRKAITFLKDNLLEEGEEIPEQLADPKQLQNIAHLLIFASLKAQTPHPLQRWACAILRIMHVCVHLENDLFSHFSETIQEQILKPLQAHIFTDSSSDAVYLGDPSKDEAIRLHKFEIKPFKATTSSIVKLLAKSDAITLTLLDKLGVRFITRDIFDAFCVIRYLLDRHLVSFPHTIPDQANNTLYPVNLFMEVMDKMVPKQTREPKEIQNILLQHLEKQKSRAEFLDKPNAYSDPKYNFIKFINRKLIDISPKDGTTPFSFFYPYEIQVMDYETYLKHLSGPSAHDKYKERQKKAARLRVLGPT